MLLTILQRGHIIVILEILEEGGFGVIPDDTADLPDAFGGGTQQPTGVIHAGHQQLLPEVHIVVLQKNSGQLSLGDMQRFRQLFFRAIAGHIILKEGIDHIRPPVGGCFSASFAGGVADIQRAEQTNDQIGQQRRQQIIAESPAAGKLCQNTVAQLLKFRCQCEDQTGGNCLP